MSMMTGLYPAEHGFIAMSDRRRLEDSVPTLASTLRGAGWQTVAFTGGINVAAKFGFDSGFDSYRTNGRSFRDNLEDLRWWLDNEREDRPFFLFLHGYDAHTPYEGFPSDRRALGLPEPRPSKSFQKACTAAEQPSDLKRYNREYDAAVHRADRYVGKALDELRNRGLLENTLLVVTSDHGEELADHGRCFHLTTLYRGSLWRRRRRDHSRWYPTAQITDYGFFSRLEITATGCTAASSKPANGWQPTRWC
ncbi:MAG: arylsulfatase A-like enzyme [Hyphomicrobiaceae bacterium]|jgi:arylsulfatase A-like enzyme